MGRGFVWGLAVCVAASVPATVGRAQEPQPAARPVVRVDSIEHDFGKIWAGPPVEHTFTLTNAGNADLRITRVHPGCGCTVVGQYPSTIAPGASGKFPFSLTTTAVSGRFEKPITISCNDPTTPEVRLILRGECRKYVDVLPASAYFGTVNPNLPAVRVLKIVNNAPSPLSLSLATMPADSKFRFALTEKVPGKEFELRVTLAQPLPPGELQTVAHLTTNLDVHKHITVNAFARIPDRLDVEPTSLTVYKPPPTAPPTTRPTSQYLFFNNYGQTPAKLVEVSVDDPAVRTRIIERVPGKAYTVHLELPPGYEPPPEGRTVVLKTDDAETPYLRVPLRRYGAVTAAASAPAATQKAAAPPPRPAELMVGKDAPAFSLQTVDGRTVSRGDLASFPATVLNFIAPNCPHCRKQVPMLEKVRAEYAPKGVRFVNISQTMGRPYTTEQTQEALKSLGSNLDLVCDPSNQLGQSFRATSFPTLFVIRPDGKIDQVIVGAKPNLDAMIKPRLDALLAGRR